MRLENKIAVIIGAGQAPGMGDAIGNGRATALLFAREGLEKVMPMDAEAYRMSGELPRAMRTYNRLLQDFPTGSYRTDSCGRMYQIANYWLSDLRDEIKQEQEKERGERSMVIPAMVHFEKGKPFLDSEGNALEYLEALHYADPTGPYADKSLWLLGYVNFYRGNFDDADLYLSQLNQHYPNSELRPASVKLAIMAKNSATGGPDYDGAKTVEAIKLIHAARTAVPELANDEGNFLDRQLVLITHQQAMKDFNVADFYQRTGHPGSAYFYYEIVRRRYPGTRLAELSKARMTELRKELDDPNRQRDVTGEAPASSGGINVLGWLRGTDRPVTAEQGEGPEGSTPLPPPRVAPTEPNVPQEFLPN